MEIVVWQVVKKQATKKVPFRLFSDKLFYLIGLDRSDSQIFQDLNWLVKINCFLASHIPQVLHRV
jgi:hypothetical protein